MLNNNTVLRFIDVVTNNKGIDSIIAIDSEDKRLKIELHDIIHSFKTIDGDSLFTCPDDKNCELPDSIMIISSSPKLTSDGAIIYPFEAYKDYELYRTKKISDSQLVRSELLDNHGYQPQMNYIVRIIK